MDEPIFKAPSVDEKRLSVEDARSVESDSAQVLTRRETLSSYLTILCAGFALISDGYGCHCSHP